MEEQMPQSQPKKGNPSLWIVLILVVLIAAAAILYFGDFFNTNTNSNTNTVANTNTETNTNVDVNTNNTISIGSTLDTTNWYNYMNSDYGYSLQVPSDWVSTSELDGTAIPLNEISSEKTYIVFSSLNSELEGEFVIKYDNPPTDKQNLLDYLNWYIEFYAPNKEQQTQQVVTENMLSGYLVTIPTQNLLGSTIAKYSYFFWNNGKPLVVLAQENSNIIKTIINSIEIN